MKDDKNPFENDENIDNDETSGVGGKAKDVIKKLFMVGTAAAFMTEESVRNYLSELKLPKEVLNSLIQGANKSKEELLKRVSKEIITIIRKINFVKEASYFIENHKFKINAEIEILKKDQDKE